MRKGKRLIIGFMVLIFLGGLTYALWPVIYGLYCQRNADAAVERFMEEYAEDTPDDPQEEESSDEAGNAQSAERPYQELYDAIQEYNRKIYEEKQIGLTDAWSYTNPSFDLEQYGIEDGAMGVVTIPSLSICLPLYLGATYEHMASGTAQLSQTSIPIGGINTNSVICGHCGWGYAKYFRYLCTIETGALVYVTNLWETLVYEVVGTDIILPYDVDKILIQEGKDMVTLFTCHPYASGGRYRYVVYCERVTDTEIPVSDANGNSTLDSQH